MGWFDIISWRDRARHTRYIIEHNTMALIVTRLHSLYPLESAGHGVQRYECHEYTSITIQYGVVVRGVLATRKFPNFVRSSPPDARWLQLAVRWMGEWGARYCRDEIDWHVKSLTSMQMPVVGKSSEPTRRRLKCHRERSVERADR